MNDAWATAFTAAVGLSLIGLPLLRRAALATGFLDQPAARKSHTTPIPYLGGIAIIVAALGGVTLGGEAGTDLGVVAIGGAVIGLVGLLDDDRTLQPGPRLAAQLAAAVAAVAVGVRAEVSGVAAVDVAVTIVWIVGITNALNLLDNMDGLAGGVAFAAAGGVFALAYFAEQEIVSTAAAGIAGACLGFLAWNVRPATIYMGDAGALFLGYVLAIAALEVDAAVDKPASFLVPLVLLALPLLDTGTVTFARLRHGRPITQGGKDHLSHRLVRSSLSPGIAVGLLVLAQAALSVIAVALGRDAVALPLGTVAAVVVLGGVAAATWPVRVYDEPLIGLSRGVRLAIVAAGAIGVVVVGAPMAAMVLARGPLDAAADDSKAALAAARAGEADRAAALFASAERSFRTAERRLHGPLSSTGLALPVVASNLEAARSLASIGIDLADAGGRVATEVDPDRLRVVNGTIPVAAVREVAPALETAERSLRAALHETRAIDGTALLGPVRTAVFDLEARLERAVDDAGRAAHAAKVTPAIFGADGPRRYFLAVQNNAELRATGGFIGNWSEVSTAGGRLDLGEVRRISVLNDYDGPPRRLDVPDDYRRRYQRFEVDRTWQNVNMSPDFPTVASVIAGLYPQSGGQPIDGVIAVDPSGLAAILELTGPITVPDWPEPITADNVVDVTLGEAYTRLPEREGRVDFLGVVAEEAWRALTAGDLGDPADVARALGGAVRARHFQFWLRDAEEQALVERLDADGGVPPVRSDSLLVVDQNAAGNKADAFLRRQVTYRATLTPDGQRAAVDAHLDLALANEAPTTGMPPIVIGPYDARFQAGENRSFVSVYTPHGFTAATLDGRPAGLESEHELGRRVHSAFLGIQGGTTQRLGVDLDGEVRLGPGGWYALDLVRQPVLHPDHVDVVIEVPEGWRIAATVGLERSGDRRAEASLDLVEDTTVWARLVPDS